MTPKDTHIIGVGEMLISENAEETLVTYSLGSCVGLTLYDPMAKVGGLLHAQLPLSATSPEKARARPAMFVDTGVVALLHELMRRGASRHSLVACVAGAASHLDDDGFFAIGRRNHTVLRRILWKNDILIHAEDVGGNVSRTMSLDMSCGRIILRREGTTRDLYAPPRNSKGGDSDAV